MSTIFRNVGRLFGPVLGIGLLLGSLAHAETPEAMDAEEAAADLPDPEAWEDGPDRETLVRFARAWGLVSSVLQEEESDRDPLDQSLREPDGLPDDLRRQVSRHIRHNGLGQDEWSNLMARMDRDPDFRNRVEMLALPYQTPTN